MAHVTTASIAAGTITVTKIAAASVTAAKIWAQHYRRTWNRYRGVIDGANVADDRHRIWNQQVVVKPR